MASCFEELQKLPEAIEVLNDAQQRALRFGDEFYVTKCVSSIVDIGIYLKTPAEQLRNEIEPLLRQIKDPVDQFTLLECLLRVEVEGNDEKRTQKVYNRGKRFSEKHDIAFGLIDLNLVVAEADWKSGEYDRKSQAMRIWADAFGHGLIDDVENGLGESEDVNGYESGESMTAEIVGQVNLFIMRPPYNPTSAELDELLNELRGQLYEEIGKSKQEKEFIEMILDQFSLARRIIPFVGKPKEQLRELDKFLQELD